VKFTIYREGLETERKLPKGSISTIIPVVELGGGDTILCSRPTGERYRSIIEQAAGITPLVILDFAGADVLTPSFFLGGPWCLWERGQLEQYPLVANLPAIALDDIEIVTKMTRTPIWTGCLVDGRFQNPELIGDLEEVDELVLSHVFEKGSVSAAELTKSIGRLGVTGWNNRLAGLWRHKLLLRTKKGRMFVYSPPWKELQNG